MLIAVAVGVGIEVLARLSSDIAVGICVDNSSIAVSMRYGVC